MSAKPSNAGKLLAIISRNSSLEMALNMFTRSREANALDGSWLRCSGSVIYLSMPNCIVFTMKSQPPPTPTA
eukprot:scaffold37397_cov36-Cyclotella_meneghiniana.AAC.3